ncbi:casein kinase I isoform delta-like [Olea europaea subsp. europaea]|uniref:Casein kinase I isoform delta-like n=1 Tax=Olea europaea subsp. europaea TaxID=158383 RepID=A0A8S0T026_OLEEU|nr:casein kinase I isoform delta-like [Olea europaea subsp. europaea]
MPRHKLTGDGQETLCTTLFPALHIKGKWIKNLYLARVCYGHLYLDYVFLDRCLLQETIPVSRVFRLVLFHQYGG